VSLVEPFRVAATAIDRRALALDHPVSPTSWSNSRPFSFLAADAYARAYFLVISLRVAIDNRLTHPESTTAPEPRPWFREQFSHEARTPLREHYS